jgi:hypothetical protein
MQQFTHQAVLPAPFAAPEKTSNTKKNITPIIKQRQPSIQSILNKTVTSPVAVQRFVLLGIIFHCLNPIAIINVVLDNVIVLTEVSKEKENRAKYIPGEIHYDNHCGLLVCFTQYEKDRF